MAPTIWTAWQAFVEGLVSDAAVHLGPGCAEELVRVLRGTVDPSTVDAAGAERAIQQFFAEVPAHRSAVANLDHTQFTHSLAVGGGSVNLGAVLASFKEANNMPAYGAAWLRLLDVADAAGAGPTAAAREYIRMRLAGGGGPRETGGDGGANPLLGSMMSSLSSPGQLDGILQSIMGAFPGLNECVAQIVSETNAAAANADGAPPPNIVDRVQAVLTGPLLEGLQQQTGTSPDLLRPCITQVLDGLRGINAVLMGGLEPGAAANTDATMAQT